MTNVIIYLIATVATGVQIYHAVTGSLWWSPHDPLPLVGLFGIVIMTLGTAWSAVKGTTAAWIVFIGSFFCWAFYLPALGTLLANMHELVVEGRFSFAAAGPYLSVLPPSLLAVATVTALLAGPMAQQED